jgi:adenylylsulfate kinase
MYDEVYCWNSENLDNYYEIFLKVPKKVVMHRDSKGIYADFKIGKVKNVAGFDLKVDFPKKPTLVIENHGSNDPTDAVNQILRVLDAS